MKNVILITYSLFLFGLLSSCSPDPEVAEQQSNNAQEQLVTVRIEALLEDPIHSPISGAVEGIQMFTLGGASVGGASGSTLRNDFPSNVGQNSLSQTINLAPSSNLVYGIYYADWCILGSGSLDFLCNQVTLNIYANDVLFHTWTKEMGGEEGIGTCADGFVFQGNVIIPNG
jgi:hypothetical protein